MHGALNLLENLVCIGTFEVLIIVSLVVVAPILLPVTFNDVFD